MSINRTIATTNRVLRQLLHDPRTLALLFVVPSLLITLLKYVFNKQSIEFSSIAPMLLGIFPMVMMFLITSITTLRERRSGTLERLMSTPLDKTDFIFGYAIAFSFVALLQALVTSLTMLVFLKVVVLGGTIPTLVGAVMAALLGTSLGLFLSAFASTEFQAIQFMPAIILPQFLVCGLLVPRDQMTKIIQWFADVMPLTYSVDAMKQITTSSTWTTTHTKDLLIVLAYSILALILGAITIKRQRKN